MVSIISNSTVHTLRERWVVLKTDNKLYSYKQQNYGKLTEVIDLKSCTNIKRLNDKNSEKAGFALIFDNKQRRFIASSMRDVNEWITHIKNVLLESFQYSRAFACT